MSIHIYIYIYIYIYICIHIHSVSPLLITIYPTCITINLYQSPGILRLSPQASSQRCKCCPEQRTLDPSAPLCPGRGRVCNV